MPEPYVAAVGAIAATYSYVVGGGPAAGPTLVEVPLTGLDDDFALPNFAGPRFGQIRTNERNPLTSPRQLRVAVPGPRPQAAPLALSGVPPVPVPSFGVDAAALPGTLWSLCRARLLRPNVAALLQLFFQQPRATLLRLQS